MTRVRINAAVRGFAAFALAAGLAVVPIAVHAQQTPAGQEQPAARATPDRLVTLPTGERVFLAAGDRAVRSILPAPNATAGPAAEPTRVHTMAVGDHFYVVPGEALPYLGRQLDLALFDVLAPTDAIRVDWQSAAHPVPGLDLEPAAGGRSTGRISDPAAFGRALARDAGLTGIRAMRPAVAAEPTADPQYPLATLTVRGLDALGAPAAGGSVSVTNADDNQRFSSLQSLVQGELSVSVPVGHYSLGVSITTRKADGTYLGDALVFLPEQEITAPQTVITADARTARTAVPVPATPHPSGLEQLQATYSRVSAAGTDTTTAFVMIGGSPEVSVTPTQPVNIGEVRWYTYFRLNSPAGTADPYLYDLVFPSDGIVPATFPDEVPAAGLATLDATYASESGPATINTSRTSFQDWERFPVRFASTATAPLRRTEYVSALPGVGWIGTAVARPSENNGMAQSPMISYQPGQRAADHYLAAPAVPGVDRGTVRNQPCPACRQGDQLLLDLQPRTDAGGHAVLIEAGANAEVKTQNRLYADGTLIAQSAKPLGSVTVPADAARLTLELDSTVSADWSTTATQVRTAWTWPTSAPSDPLPAGRTCTDPAAPCSFQPLLFAEYDAGVDTANAVKAGVPAKLTVLVRHQAYDPAPAADHLTLEVSGDDGATWTPVTTTAAGGGRFTATVTPAAGFLSLRVHATDPADTTLDQTVVRALRVLG